MKTGMLEIHLAGVHALSQDRKDLLPMVQAKMLGLHKTIDLPTIGDEAALLALAFWLADNEPGYGKLGIFQGNSGC